MLKQPSSRRSARTAASGRPSLRDRYGTQVWEDVVAAGQPYGITPYGTETMHVLRAEKGYPIVGQDTDGSVTPQDAGMDWIVSKTKEFIGRRSYSRADTGRSDRKHLVSVLPVDGQLFEYVDCRPGTGLSAAT